MKGWEICCSALLAVLPAVAPAPAHAFDWDVRGELGYQGSVAAGTPRVLELNRPYAQLQGSFKPAFVLGAPFSSEFTATVRAWWDFVGTGEASARALKATFSTENSQFTLGLQTISWGETFGVYIADIVNPRDLRDPLLNDIGWMRVPILGANWQYLYNQLSVQLVAVPVASSNILPAADSPGDFFPIEIRRQDPPAMTAGKDAEFGARVGYLFDMGLDISAFAYQHQNRNVVYVGTLVAGAPALVPQVKPIRTVGLSFSEAWESIVLRGDAVYHFATPVQDYDTLAVTEVDDLQGIVGADYSLPGWGNAGVQYHLEGWRNGERTTLYQWASARVSTDFWEELLGAELFAFKGIDNTDLWLQLQIHWRPGTAWDLSLRGDLLGPKNASRRGMLAYNLTRQRLYTWLTWRF